MLLWCKLKDQCFGQGQRVQECDKNKNKDFLQSL